MMKGILARRFLGVAAFTMAAVAGAGLSGCKPNSTQTPATSQPEAVRGTPIGNIGKGGSAGSGPANGSNAAPKQAFVPADFSKPDEVRDGIIQLGWDKLAGFKFDVYEAPSPSGRALLRSDDTIPAPVKAYHSNRVSIIGFVLPLRTRKGRVTEFLLLRDQGACCFGPQAQINHFIRVKLAAGIEPGDPVPWQVSGLLRVGEIYIQGYLTGIYELEAESAREKPLPSRYN